uniref:Calmodulin regulated spectrin associated protein family member 2 n=1 Tax=Hippocampus comes TaxID=109280 RepID=A0A3Q2X8T8_HIPCM
MGDAAHDGGVRRTFIVPAIRSFEHYDFTRAKISSSLTWLVAKAFGSDEVPDELVEPFYRDQYNQEHLKPPVASLLQSAELYCRAGSLILRSDAVKPLLGHNAVIQALAQKGLYVTDQDRLVTERDLTSTPILMTSHLALIDTLMMAYTVEMMSVERVMSCVNRHCSAGPSHIDKQVLEQPYDTEDAITMWLNKVNEHLRDILVEEQKLKEGSDQESNSTPKARYRRAHAQQNSAPLLPLVDNLLKDNTDGCALAALLHFYCPRAVRLEDICLKEIMSLADSLYNLQLVQDFCRTNLNRCCHFSLEDMLYAHASIKSNYLVFLAELFWWFEVVKPSFVRPRVFDPNGINGVECIYKLAETFVFLSELGVMKRSTSMSFVDGCVGTWPQERRSSTRGISFEIPLDGDATVPSCEAPALHRMTRSASSDGLGFRLHFAPRGGMKRHVSLMPVNVNGQSRDITEDEEDFTPLLPDTNHHGNHSGHISPSTPPSIEEALKIIHDTERPHASLGMGDRDNGFFLHDARPSGSSGAVGQGVDPGAAKARFNDRDSNSLSTDDTGIHVKTEEIQSLDEDSSLRDYSDIDPDCETVTRSYRSSAPTLPRSHTVSPASSCSGGGMVRMTSFAEQKFRKLEGRSSGGTTPESSNIGTPPLPITSPSPVTPSPKDPSHLIASEMIQLRMKLEEKRRAIEAQKKKVEEAFTRHRQKMGRTAFLNVVRRKGVTSPLSPNSTNTIFDMVKCREKSDLAEYTRSIERLNTSLGFLQTEMQRLAQQQERIMSMKEQQQKAWVIPPPAPSPHRQLRELRSSSVTGRASARGSVGSLSPVLSSSGSANPVSRPSAGLKRRPASFHARTPRTPRPNDLKITPINRMLNTPTSVDSLPRLRRFTSSQTHTSSFAYLSSDEGSRNSKSLETKETREKEEGSGEPEDSRRRNEKSRTPEVLCQPTSEIQGNKHPQEKRELVKVTLSGLWTPESQAQETTGETGEDQKMCCGFFFKDDAKDEEDMAAKKAALLEKRLRREKEAQEKKQQQELDQEQKKEAARLKAEEEQQKRDDEKERREYIKNEYLRRKQLKLMEDMDQVVKPRCGSLKKKPRPKSIHRDVMESSTPPVRGTGVRPRGYSVSSVSLASLNLTDNESNHQDNKKYYRPESSEGFSSCPSAGSRNGEKDWENDSTTSSTPSNTEYTGPKLYKEPSAKSNKHIIQNALAHCCLAGKVNEGQKNKIIDEIEKSEANNFLVLFRDTGCQFRSVYAYCPETEEITRLAGIGPKTITGKMIERLYKYNSDRKQFSQIPAKTMSASVDAITIASHLWHIKKHGTPKKMHLK